ncbi:unnamed protein product [Moneuplotes crassus]|uniref:Uncharacterized protein n=1 Tax=Euplotes crassus TaxID=5936 RepID=A0AAD1XMS9_EUPCR|nr:unnamed protein product [Moneuplotes crassus]
MCVTCKTKFCQEISTEYCQNHEMPVCGKCKADQHYLCKVEQIRSSQELEYQVQSLDRLIEITQRHYEDFYIEGRCPKFIEAINGIKASFVIAKKKVCEAIDGGHFLDFKDCEIQLNNIRKEFSLDTVIMDVMSYLYQQLILKKGLNEESNLNAIPKASFKDEIILNQDTNPEEAPNKQNKNEETKYEDTMKEVTYSEDSSMKETEVGETQTGENKTEDIKFEEFSTEIIKNGEKKEDRVENEILSQFHSPDKNITKNEEIKSENFCSNPTLSATPLCNDENLGMSPQMKGAFISNRTKKKYIKGRKARKLNKRKFKKKLQCLY